MQQNYSKTLFLLFLSSAVFGQQNTSNIVDLSIFCPYTQVQYRATCYSYAVVYTAMSTEFNIKNNIRDANAINTSYFSAGVVASYHNSSLAIHRRSAYCGKWGTAEKSLQILEHQGTTLNSQYDCHCKGFSRIKNELKPTDKFYKISGYEVLTVNNQYSQKSLGWIKNALDNKHPVIVGIFQDNQLRNLKSKDILDTLPDKKTLNEISKHLQYGTSNHVICILGYDDNYSSGRGYFLLKNNFSKWGNGTGFAWVPYTFILPLIHEAYYIKSLL